MRPVIYLLFFVSGFVGLVYEAIFSRYLKLFLGHSSYGQLLTLVVFMGGLGLGAFIAGRFASRVRNPFRAYALIEFAAGFWGLAFHPAYEAATSWYYENAALFSAVPGGFAAGKILLSLFLTVPFATLLGMTFPLLAVGVMRFTGDGGKRTLSLLYFTNSFGAALGILVTSYVLIRDFGTFGSLLIAGCGNALVGLGFYIIAGRIGDAAGSGAVPESAPARSASNRVPNLSGPGPGANASLLLAVSFGTGFASFIYEIGWIRMLSLLLGSSTHSFDIMISAFVLGLAFGGLYAKRLIARSRNLIATLGVVQVLMGIFAVCSIYFYRPFFEAANASHAVFQKAESAYFFYSAFKYLLALGLMFPASFCAGMTLPLITYVLCARTSGERYTGYVYGWNTTGSICGAVVGGLLLLPALQLKWTLATGAALDMMLGVVILLSLPAASPLLRRVALTATATALVPLLFTSFNKDLLVRGVFRWQMDLSDTKDEILEVRDGRTATISVRKSGHKMGLATNGKSDGAVVMKSQRGIAAPADDMTVAQLAFLPMLTKTEPYNCAIVGMGTGMTLHHLLADDLLEEVDLIEIEKAVLELSALFRPTNERAFTDPRVNFVVRDAKSYFYQAGKKYDLIISEPSNPWVSGVASLFTKEYYRQVRKFLKPGGLLVQWAHNYEFSDDLAYSILTALSEFPYFEIYSIGDSGHDFMIIAGEGPSAYAPFERWDSCEGIRGDFAEMGWQYEEIGPGNFIASSRTLRPILEKWKSTTNSDYFPYVDQYAEIHFFTKSSTQFFEVLQPGFGCYQEVYEPERFQQLRSRRLSSKRRGFSDLREGKLLRTMLKGIDKDADWAGIERAVLEATRPFFRSGYWHEMEAVRIYADAVAEGIAPAKHADRFLYLKAVAVDDDAAAARLLPAAIATFGEEQRPGALWLRSFVVTAARLHRPELITEVMKRFMDEDKLWRPEESLLVADVLGNLLSPAGALVGQSEPVAADSQASE